MESAARRTYREAAEAYLGGEVEAAAPFHRPGPLPLSATGAVLERALDWLNDRLEGRVGRLRGNFLLAVTKNKVHALKYTSGSEGLRIEEELAAFDRDAVGLRSVAGGEVLCLSATERGRTREIDLDGEAVEHSPGASEVVAALSE